MKTPVLLSLMIALAAHLQPACAQTSSNWVVISRNDSTVSSIDPERIVVAGDGTVRAWVKTEYRYGRWSRTRSQFIYSSLDQEGFRCGSRQSALLRWVSYGQNGRVVSSGEIPYPEWVEVVPESVGEYTLLRVCAYARRR